MRRGPEAATSVSGELDGAVVLVTGSARGIGEGIARRFHHDGATIIAVDRDERGLGALAAALGERVRPVVADVADRDSVHRAIPPAIAELGRLDVCVNNAGVFGKAPLLEITQEEWDHVLATNARSVLLVIQVAAPVMIRAGRGRIINMASMAAKAGTPGEAHYAASKAAVVALTRIAAMELGPSGITVNCVCPGYVLTDMGAGSRTPEQVDEWTSRTPLGRLQTVADVAGVVRWLASDDAASCTGQAINVTGGMVMH
jgi:NAD(P)-dependent dehydrogenase (short-subunit alcohol dehydrogenase family)